MMQVHDFISLDILQELLRERKLLQAERTLAEEQKVKKQESSLHSKANAWL